MIFELEDYDFITIPIQLTSAHVEEDHLAYDTLVPINSDDLTFYLVIFKLPDAKRVVLYTGPWSCYVDSVIDEDYDFTNFIKDCQSSEDTFMLSNCILVDP
jgi:hypothetical protein